MRPGGGGLLTSFAGGSRPKPSLGTKEKGYDEVIKYDRDFLLAFKEVRGCPFGCLAPRQAGKASILIRVSAPNPLQRCTDVPAELEASGSDVLVGGENEFSTPEERCVHPYSLLAALQLDSSRPCKWSLS